MSWREEDWRQSPDQRADGGAGDIAGRSAPGRRSLTETFGRAASAGPTPGPGKVSLTQRLREGGGAPQPIELPYRGEMEAAFGQDFAGVSAVSTTSDALGGTGGMAQGESVAFAGPTPSRQTVAHELAHVVQHRRGETAGQALAENGSSPLDRLADAMATAAADHHTGQARLPRPLVIEVLGDRFTVSCKADALNRLVLLVRYDGPYQSAGEHVEAGTVRLPCHRLEGQYHLPLDVSVLEIQERGVLLDVTGRGEEIVELSFNSTPHETDPDARTHRLKTRTNNRDGWSYPIDILLPSDSRPAPEGLEAGELEREASTACLVALGGDTFHLRARRFGTSNSVHLRLDADAGEQHGQSNLLVPFASPEAPVRIALVAQSDGELLVDLDGDGQSDLRLVHTAVAREPDEDASQVHEHAVHAYDPEDVRVASARFSVRGEPWEVSPGMDAGDNPPPASAPTPPGQSPAQEDRPTEGSQPIRLHGGDWEIRIDGDGDRHKELLFRFHQEDWGAPVRITAIQLSSGWSASFSALASESNDPAHMEPTLDRAADGATPAEITLFGSIMGGDFIWLKVAPPADDGAHRTYTFTVVSGTEITEHSFEFPAEITTGAPLAGGAESEETPVAGIRSMTARFGELGDRFLFTVEDAPGGLTLGIAGLNPDGTVGDTSGHRLAAMEVSCLSMVGVTATQVGLDLTGDGEADVIIHDAISQPLGRTASRLLTVERQHLMSLSGPAMASASSAHFMLRGPSFHSAADRSPQGREAAGAAATVGAIGAQRQEGTDVDALILRFRGGVSGQISVAGEKGFISPAMLSSWRSLSEDMLRLGVFVGAPPERRAAIAASEGAVRESAAKNAAILFAELETATTGERRRIDKAGTRHQNPYTGAVEEDVAAGRGTPAGSAPLIPAPAASLAAAIEGSDDARAAALWVKLQDGVERWAQTRLERELGVDHPLAAQGRYMSAMADQLGEIRNRPRLTRVFATFIADDCYREEDGFFPSLPLQLWVWQDDDGETWRLRDLTSPDKPFNGSAGPDDVETCSDRPADLPPHALFEQLDDKKKYPVKGLIRYEIPGTGVHDQVVCHAEKKWYEWMQEIGMIAGLVGLAAVGLAVTIGTGGAAGAAVGVVGSYVLAGSALAGAAGAAGEIADAYQHGWLDGMVLTVDLLQIAGGIASAGAIVAGRLVQGATAAHAAGGARLWSGNLARLAAMSGKAYVPLTGAALVTDAVSVAVMSVDTVNKLNEIDAALPEGAERDDAKVKLLAMLALAGGLTVLSVRGDLPELAGGRKPPILLDTVNGVPYAHVGGVRAGGVDLDVAGPELHATARWTGREPGALALSPEELPWYRGWMEQPQGQKVRFGPDGEPEILLPALALEKPPGIEKKLAAIAKSADLAHVEATFARTAELDALREANGGHLDIDPTSPAWPAERAKLVDTLAGSLGDRRKADQLVSRYEAIRTGAFGPGQSLHADQAARLGRFLPPGEVDAVRRLYPECEVYVQGDAAGDGAAVTRSVPVVVVVPRGTSPDLMSAMEQRAAGLALRPDPDYLASHPALGRDGTVGVEVKAVTAEQFFGMATVRVGDGPPVDLHRLDVPTGPGGKPYVAAELDSMNKAGYELDPATGQWVLRSEVTRAGLAGTAFGALRGANTVCGGPLPSEAIGQEVLRKLALGDREALRVVGVEPSPHFDTRQVEWGLGQRESDGSWVLVKGESAAIDWSKVPGVKGRGHSHPLMSPSGEVYPLRSARGARWVMIDDLVAGKEGASLPYLAPSGSDLAFAAREGRHLVVTPYIHLGGGKIGTPEPGSLDPLVEFEIVSCTAEGLWLGVFVGYRAQIRIRAGDEILYTGDLWGLQSPHGSHVQFDGPADLRPLPPGFEPGQWIIRPDGVQGAGTTQAGGDLEDWLHSVGLPRATDPVMASLLRLMDSSTRVHLAHLRELHGKGRVIGFAEWYRGVELDPSPTRIADMLAEIRQTSLMAAERPGITIDIGADGRAPTKHRQRADGTWEEVLGPDGKPQKDRSFDIELKHGDGDEVARSIEIKCVHKPIKRPADLGNTLAETAAKVQERAANRPGLEIPGRKELRMEVELFHGEVVSSKDDVKLIYDGAGKITTTDRDGNLRHFPDGTPKVANLYDQIADYLSRSTSAATLDRVTLADGSGILASYDNMDGTFIRVQ